jgi:hypothetical protein
MDGSLSIMGVLVQNLKRETNKTLFEFLNLSLETCFIRIRHINFPFVALVNFCFLQSAKILNNSATVRF